MITSQGEVIAWKYTESIAQRQYAVQNCKCKMVDYAITLGFVTMTPNALKVS